MAPSDHTFANSTLPIEEVVESEDAAEAVQETKTLKAQSALHSVTLLATVKLLFFINSYQLEFTELYSFVFFKKKKRKVVF